MNNSKIALDNLPDEDFGRDERFRDRETTIVRILTAIEQIEKSEAWSTLKIELFDSLAERLGRSLRDEARSEQPDTLKLNRISGQLQWAEKYADLGKMKEQYRNELLNIRQKLHGTE